MSFRSFGRYQVAQQLGAGTFGAVYQAWDEKLGRPVALKLLHKHYDDDPSIRARFEREAKIMATLQHPHIVAIHDFGEEDGTLFIVMALFAGGTLQRRMAVRAAEGQPFSTEETLGLLEPVCSALDRAHAMGVVHRDLKPGNILFDDNGKLALTDFGIARIFAGAATPQTLTQSGQEIGTPLYMAPEQWRGAKDEIDGRTDLYALGCLAYHLLTGSAPFVGDSAYTLMHAHLFSPAPKPSDSRRDLPQPWDQGVARLLAKIPADRFATGAAFLDWMREALAGRPAPLPGPKTVVPAPLPDLGVGATSLLPVFPTGPTIAPPPRRRGPWVAAAAALVVLAALAAGLILRRAPSGGGAEPEQDRPEVPFRGRDPLAATAAAPHVSSLGLRFVPIELEGGRPLLVGRSETRMRDFRAFVQSGQGRLLGRDEAFRYDAPGAGDKTRSLTARGWVEAGATWEQPGFAQSDDHPVTCVSLHDAMAFADWLSRREQDAGQLPRTWRYRVPFASEWSAVAATFVGGKGVPNYAGDEARDNSWPATFPLLSGWQDGHPRTSPATDDETLASLRGNVWEWTLPQDPSADRDGAELRGGAWSTNRAEETAASFLRPEPRGTRRSDTGFRLVLVQESAGRPQPPIAGPASGRPILTAIKQRRAEAAANAGMPGRQVVPLGRGAPAFQPTAVPAATPDSARSEGQGNQPLPRDRLLPRRPAAVRPARE